jgi:hypothetical protein
VKNAMYSDVEDSVDEIVFLPAIPSMGTTPPLMMKQLRTTMLTSVPSISDRRQIGMGNRKGLLYSP